MQKQCAGRCITWVSPFVLVKLASGASRADALAGAHIAMSLMAVASGTGIVGHPASAVGARGTSRAPTSDEARAYASGSAWLAGTRPARGRRTPT